MSKLRFLFVLMLLFGIAGSIFAQEEIEVGDSVEGEEDNEAVQYELFVEEGQTVGITLESDDFDTYLELYDEDGFFINSNDDFDGRNSYLTYTADDSGVVVISVRGFGSDGPEGDYELTVEELEVVAEMEGGDIAYGDEVDVEPEGALAVSYSFEGTEGDVISIFVNSEAGEDTRLVLEDSEGDEVTFNDDSGNGTNPAIRRFPLPASGTYTIIVTGFNDAPIFSEFELSLQESEYLLVNGAPQTLTLDEDATTDVMFLEAEEDVSYIVTITLSEDIDSTLYINMMEEEEPFARTRFSLSGTPVFSFVFTAQDDGIVNIELEFFSFDEEVDVTIEAQVLE